MMVRPGYYRFIKTIRRTTHQLKNTNCILNEGNFRITVLISELLFFNYKRGKISFMLFVMAWDLWFITAIIFECRFRSDK